MSFAAFSRQRQTRVIRKALQDLVGDVPIRLVTHGFNSTYRVMHPDGDAAVRLNINSRRTPRMVRGEVAFVQRAHDQGVQVPEPALIFGGGATTTVKIEGIPHDVPVAAYRWVEGRAPSEVCSPATTYNLGSTMSSLHRAAKGWKLPEGCDRPTYRDVLDGQPWRMTGSAAAEVRRRADEVLSSLGQPHLVHFDLHLGNVKIRDGRLTAYDFDDSVWGHPAADAAQTLFYFRWAPDVSRAESAFWEGLGANPETLGVDVSTIELLVAARAVLLANDILGSVSQEFILMAPRYVEVTELRLQYFLETGVYDPKVAKMKE